MGATKSNERELCSACGKFLRPTHHCDPGDRERLERYRNPELAAEARRGLVAMRLANDLEAYHALMHGEKVHPSRLDREALARLRAEGLNV